jgi:hypothetical protein
MFEVSLGKSARTYLKGKLNANRTGSVVAEVCLPSKLNALRQIPSTTKKKKKKKSLPQRINLILLLVLCYHLSQAFRALPSQHLLILETFLLTHLFV